MADRQIGNHVGVSSSTGTVQNGGTAADAGLKNTNITTIADARARLQAINATYYTNARLNQMTFNDMIYAIRQNDETKPAGTRI